MSATPARPPECPAPGLAGSILLIDDDEDWTFLLRRALEERGHRVHTLQRAEGGPELLAAGGFDLVLLDNLMPGKSGIEFLEDLERTGTGRPVILMTNDVSAETAMRAMNLGAFNYVGKGTDLEEFLRDLAPLLEEALRISRPVRPVHLEVTPERPEEHSALHGTSKCMVEVFKHIGRFARLNQTVLIQGETGTGKELVARAIHTHSSRKDRPFVPINCAALVENNLLESELFGHEKGAFTGADKLRKGRFEYANGGTLFLDEIGDMPLASQAKLLRVLENKEVFRIGSNEQIRVDVRLVSATFRDLRLAVAEGKFREDLYYRLNALTIKLPPLRERGADVEHLADYFLAREAAAAGLPVPELHPAARERLRTYSWPGNVRELKSAICKAVQTCRGAQILPAHLELDAAPPPAEPAAGEEEARAGLRAAIRWAWDTGQEKVWPLLRDLLERELLAHAVAQPDHSQVQAALRLGMARNTLRDRLKAYGLETPPPDGGAARPGPLSTP